MRMIGLLLAAWCAFGAPASAQERSDRDPSVAALVAEVSPQRLQDTVEKLASFKTRHTLSDATSPTHGIGAARQWIFDELKRTHPRLQVSFDTHHVARQRRITRDVEIRNVMALLPGRSPRRIYITAHYDSLALGSAGQLASNARPEGQPAADPQLDPAQDYNVDAPGANDNGSGTALTMELARVLGASGLEFDATLVFMLWAGEEQGLIGSRAHVQRLAADRLPVEANFNSDIVGGSRGGNGIVDAASVRVYSEGPEDSMSRSLARYVERAASLYVPSHRVTLLARQDRFARGSDHASFNQHGYAAVVFREARENFSRQHAADDTPDGVDYDYLAENARVTTAAAATLALAPPAPRVTNERGVNLLGRQPSGYDANLRWDPSPGAVAYRIYRREASVLDWQFSQLVGPTTQFVLPGVSIDNFVFGVAAVGAGGHESLVNAYVSPARRDPPVEFVR